MNSLAPKYPFSYLTRIQGQNNSDTVLFGGQEWRNWNLENTVHETRLDR